MYIEVYAIQDVPIKLSVNPFDLIKTIKEKISKIRGMPLEYILDLEIKHKAVNDFEMLNSHECEIQQFNEFDDSRTLSYYNIKSGDILKTICRKDILKKSIFVKTLTNGTIRIFADENETISVIKTRLQNLSDVPADQLRLIFAGHQLEDGQTLAHYNILHDSTLYAILKLRGGGPLSFNFNKLNNESIQEHKFGPRDPKNLMIVDDGLNAKGICKTRSCKAYNQRVFAHLGYGEKINVNDILKTTGKCCFCDKLMKYITNFCFVRSTWFFKGNHSDGTIINTSEIPNHTKNNGYSMYKDGDDCEWGYLEITVRPYSE